MPDVPTFAEGGVPEFDLAIWNGLVAPKGTPRAVLDKIAAAVSQVMDSPEYRERVEKQFASQIPAAAERGPDGFRRAARAGRCARLDAGQGHRPAARELESSTA